MAMAMASQVSRLFKVLNHTLEKQMCCTRRAALVSLAITTCPVKRAEAFSLGISGPKEWLKEQKKKTAEFVLNPIARSRQRLENAFLLLSSNETQNLEEAVNLVKVAARDCIPLEAGSLPDIQTRTGVEVCTFRLLVKNASSLLDDTDPVRVKAYEALDSLIRSFKVLDESLAEGSSPPRSFRDAFGGTYSALDDFEAGIRACLGIA